MSSASVFEVMKHFIIQWRIFIARYYKVLVLLLFIVSFSLSTYIHVPYPPSRPPLLDNPGLIYTDIVHGLFIPRFLDVVSEYGVLDYRKIADYWYNSQVIASLIYGRLYSITQCPVPYRDYKFEYPPVIAATWYFSTCIAYFYTYRFIKAPENPFEYRSIVESYVMPIHFAIQIIVLLVFSVITAICLYKLLQLENMAIRLSLLFILPSTVLYITYNWDIITAAFVVMALYSFIRNRHGLAGVLLGLAVATKVLPIFIALALLYDLLQKAFKEQVFWAKLWQYSTGLFISISIPYGIPMALYRKGFADFLNHHLTWYCENCLYLPLIQDVWSPLHRILFFSLATIFMLAILTIDVSSSKKLYVVAFLTLSTGIVFNYVFSPQMIIMLAPLALLALPRNMLTSYIIADAANALIMVMFFKDPEIRALIAKYINIPVKNSPWTLDSPVQWVAFIRNWVLLIILLFMLYDELKNISKGAE